MNWKKKIKYFLQDKINPYRIEYYKKQNKEKSYKKSLRKEKINIVFVCHRPAIWGYQKTIFEACISDIDFDVTIVAIPNKKELPQAGLLHEVYESEGAEEYFKEYPCRVINGYNYETHEWFDLKELKPDYVFFQTPYNICRPKLYHSKEVNKFARICYVHYGLSMLKDQCVFKEFAKEFFQYCSLIFAETEYHKRSYKDEIIKYNSRFNFNNIFLSGSPVFDNLKPYKDVESSLWRHRNHEYFRIIWTPRWSTGENNCNFLEYKDELFCYAENNNYDFIFRPHPQAFLNYIAEDIMSEADIESLKKDYTNSKNCTLDLSKDYLATLYSSDVLISDPSGIDFEYLLTGKPIIYTKKSDEWANDFAKNVFIAASYVVTNWDELQKTLEMLRNGNDPMKKKRAEIVEKYFYFPENGAGYTIKELIKRDFYGKN